jgi:LPXTG-motif cell wall-anchored protein
MKQAALMLVVLMAVPFAALWAQSDPYAPAGDPPSAQADPQAAPGDPMAAPADPQPAPVDPSATTPPRDYGATDPDGDGNALPATASHGPLILLMGLLAIGMFLVLKVFRRRSADVS